MKPEKKEEQRQSVEDLVKARKARKAEMEERFARERENRFENLEEEEPEKEEEEDDERPALEEEEPEEDPPKKKPEKKSDEESSDDDDFDDFDDIDDEEAPSDEEEEEGNEEEEDEDEGSEGEPQNIRTLRENIKKQGQARKAAEARLIEMEQELERIKTEKKNLEEKNKDIASNQINWNSHDQVTPMWNQFDDIVSRGASTFSDAATAKRFYKDSQGDLLQEYYDVRKDAKTPDDRLEADIKFKSLLSDRYDIDDATPLISTVRDAMEKYIEIRDTVDDLKKRHEEGRLSVGVQAYEEGVKPFEDLFDDLGEVDQDFIEANPQSVEAVVAKKISEDSEFKNKAEKQKDRIKQFVFGLRPLTQEEISKAEKRAQDRGLTTQEYLDLRQDNYEKSRRKFLTEVFYSGMAMDEFGEMKKVYDRYLANKKKRETARKTISKAKPPEDSSSSRKPEKLVREKDRAWVPPSQRSFSD